MLRKRMSAEQFADAAGTIIGPLFYDSMVMYKPSNKIGDHPFARASLVVNNSFLTALGRPNRETVSTSRESQANLLQALELTNGERFNSMISKGAKKLRVLLSETEGMQSYDIVSIPSANHVSSKLTVLLQLKHLCTVKK